MERTIKRIILAVLAVSLSLFLLLGQRSGDDIVVDEAADAPENSAAEDPTAGVVAAEGELDWQYPPGWIDFSDLPDKMTLGDEEQPGLTNWRYLLVNHLDQSNYLMQSYYPEMSEIEHGYAFQTRAIEDLRAFIDDARAEGYVVSIALTYRSYVDQRVRFNGMASTIYDRGGCTLAEAEQQAMAMGYYPGTDEHQTGLAVNFVAEGGEAKFSTPVLQWMKEHCHEYGFILRYPEGREDKTGRDAEAGHFRYVGQVAAEYIMRKGITLEEFRQAYVDQEEIEDGGWLW